jgi:hypothetical protein
LRDDEGSGEIYVLVEGVGIITIPELAEDNTISLGTVPTYPGQRWLVSYAYSPLTEGVIDGIKPLLYTVSRGVSWSTYDGDITRLGTVWLSASSFKRWDGTGATAEDIYKGQVILVSESFANYTLGFLRVVAINGDTVECVYTPLSLIRPFGERSNFSRDTIVRFDDGASIYPHYAIVPYTYTSTGDFWSEVEGGQLAELATTLDLRFAQLATQTWLPAVETYDDLPDPHALAMGINYLCRVLVKDGDEDSGVYQCINNSFEWTYFSDNLDFIDETELAAALLGKVDNAAFTAAMAAKVDITAFNTAMAGKVDTTALTEAMAGKVDITAFNTAMAGKVDNAAMAELAADVAGRVDNATFFAALAAKVDNSTYTAGMAAKVDKAEGSRLMTNAEGTKLAGIAAGAEVNVNADWVAEAGKAKILNKPDLDELVSTYKIGEVII